MIPPSDAGVYVLVLALRASLAIRAGRLGRHVFPAGLYLYVGSARRNLDARLARHHERRKPLRWHIDYLTTRAHVVGAAVVPWARGRECLVARRLLAVADGRVVAPGFGSSDCRCPTHLVGVSFWRRPQIAPKHARYDAGRAPMSSPARGERPGDRA